MRFSAARSDLPRSTWWVVEGNRSEASAAPPRLIAEKDSLGGRSTDLACLAYTLDARPADELEIQSAQKRMVEGEEPPQLKGGEASAEQDRHKPHIPVATLIG